MAALRRLIGAVVLLLFPLAAFAIEVQDDRGETLVLAQPARRIVSLAPHATELIYAAGAGERLIAVTAFSDYPEAASRLPALGDSGKVDVERVLTLKPDLVIAWHSGNHAGDVAQLERLGLKVFVTEPRRLQDIPRLLRQIGKLAGTAGVAEHAALDFERQRNELSRRYSSRPPVSVFYQIWDAPLMSVNGEHLISEAISLCGGRNVFAAISALTPAISAEAVLAANPQAIVASGSLYRDERVWQAWRRFPNMAAVKNKHLFFIHPDLIQRQTPRILQGARQLCEQLETVRR